MAYRQTDTDRHKHSYMMEDLCRPFGGITKDEFDGRESNDIQTDTDRQTQTDTNKQTDTDRQTDRQTDTFILPHSYSSYNYP